MKHLRPVMASERSAESFMGTTRESIRRWSCTLRVRFAAVAWVVIGLSAAWVCAQDPPEPPKSEQPAEPADAKPAQPPEAKKKAPPDRYLAILQAGVVHTVTQGDLHDVTIVTKNGRILDIGRNPWIPEDAERLDARGYRVYPGLIAATSGGLLGNEPPEDTSNVFGLNVTLALAAGITTVGSGNTAAKLTYGTVEDMIVRRDVFHTLTYSTRDPRARHELHAALDRVRRYVRDLEDYNERKKHDPDAKEPDKEWLKGPYEAYLKLLRRETTAVVTANTVHEILSACRLARQYNLRLVLRGAAEGWIVPREIAAAGAGVILTPRSRTAENELFSRPTGPSIENPAILHLHGVTMAFVPGITTVTTWGVAGRDLMHLSMESAFAVRGGLVEDAALRSITIDAARLLGVDHRVGSIEPGKDADFVIADGDLLHYMTHARWTVVNGRIAYDKEKETLFSHIRPGGDRDAPPPVDYWPRRLGADQ